MRAHDGSERQLEIQEFARFEQSQGVQARSIGGGPGAHARPGKPRVADATVYGEDFALVAVADGGKLKLERLTLAEGSRGALVNRGELELDQVRVVDNIAKNVPAIIENYGQLRVIGSEISYNQLAGTQRDAGTVLNYGRLDLLRSSIESNWISRRYDSLVAASAVLNLGELKLAEVRVRENTAMPELVETSLGAIVNVGNGAYQASDLTLEHNEPVDTLSAARLAN